MTTLHLSQTSICHGIIIYWIIQVSVILNVDLQPQRRICREENSPLAHSGDRIRDIPKSPAALPTELAKVTTWYMYS